MYAMPRANFTCRPTLSRFSLLRCIVHIKAIYLSIHQTAHHGVISPNPTRHAHPLSVRFVVGRGGYNHYPPYRPPHVLNANSRAQMYRTQSALFVCFDFLGAVQAVDSHCSARPTERVKLQMPYWSVNGVRMRVTEQHKCGGLARREIERDSMCGDQ
jgi:hypothetical protein